VLVVDGYRGESDPISSALAEHPALTIVEDRERFASTTGLVELRPDVVVMHLYPDDQPVVDVCREVRLADPSTRVLVLTEEVDAGTLFDTIAAGASGYLRRDTSPLELQDAVLTIAAGGSVLDPLMATAVFERLRDEHLTHPADDAFATLSPQEERILDMIAEGMTNGEIASALSLSQKTIKNYASQIYAKLNVERRSQAARLATERRMLKQR
jgi:DNA-binding NarL/FixJ family response regulator